MKRVDRCNNYYEPAHKILVLIIYLYMIHLLNCLLSGHLIQKAKARLPVFAETLCKVNFKHGTSDRKHDDVKS